MTYFLDLHATNRGIQSIWGTETPEFSRSYTLGMFGDGWHVDRVLFEKVFSPVFLPVVALGLVCGVGMTVVSLISYSTGAVIDLVKAKVEHKKYAANPSEYVRSYGGGRDTSEHSELLKLSVGT